MAHRFELSDKEQSVIEPLLPIKPRGVPCVDDRRVLNGISGFFGRAPPWEDMPNGYGPRTTVYNRFARWRKAGVWARILEHLQKDIEDSLYMVDSSVVRVHQHGTGARRSAAKPMDGAATKRQGDHAVV